MNFVIYEGKKMSSSPSVYEVTRGGFGQAIQRRNERTQEAVVKIIANNRHVEEAEREALILKELKALGSEKVNIVKFHDSFIFSSHYCLEFERLDMDLLEYCDGRPLSLPRIRPILKQVAEVLSFLHENGYIHGDIKPQNIMVADHLLESPKVKIIDFSMTTQQSRTWRGMILQTLCYTAPEVLMGATVTQAIDIWSLGCLAAELLTGELLFPGDDEHEMMDLIVSTIGMPPWHLLRDGLYTNRYFVQNRRRFPPKWTKSAGFHPVDIGFNPTLKLHGLLKVSQEGSEEEKEAAEYDLACFINLVVRMLHMDPRERTTPRQMLQHPFFTLSHLTTRCSSYLQMSHDLLEASRHEDQPAEHHSPEPLSVEEVSVPSAESPLGSYSRYRSDSSESGYSVEPDSLEGDALKGPEEPSKPSSQDLSDNTNMQKMVSACLSACCWLLPALLCLLFVLAQVQDWHYSAVNAWINEHHVQPHRSWTWIAERTRTRAPLNGHQPTFIGLHRSTTTVGHSPPSHNQDNDLSSSHCLGLLFLRETLISEGSNNSSTSGELLPMNGSSSSCTGPGGGIAPHYARPHLGMTTEEAAGSHEGHRRQMMIIPRPLHPWRLIVSWNALFFLCLLLQLV